MKNTIMLLVLMLVGCSESSFVMPDSGIVSDGAAPDAWENADAGVMPGTDSGIVEADASVGHDSAVTSDAGSDAGVDAAMTTDAGADAAVPPMGDSGVGRGTAVELGVLGATTCVLTSINQMWCWGGSMVEPTYIADAVELEGICAIGTDGNAFCLGGATLGSDASVVGNNSYVRRADGVYVAVLGTSFTPPTVTWTPPSAIEELPAPSCAVLADGTARCWDVQGTAPTATLTSPMNLGAATDVARFGNAYDNTFRACVVDATGTHCVTGRGTTGNALLSHGSEVEMAYGRTCAVVRADWSGMDDDGTSTSHFHPAGIYCTSNTPASLTTTGYWPFSTLSSTDVVGQYTRTDTSAGCVAGTSACSSSVTQLRVGSAHACFIQDGVVMCWGDASHNQLGGHPMSRTPVTVF